MNPNITTILLIVLAVVMFVLLSGKKSKKPTPNPKPAPQQKRAGWYFAHSYGMPATPEITGNGFAFNMPRKPDGVHTVLRDGRFAGDTMTMQCTVAGGGIVAKGSDSPALACLFFETHGDLKDPNSRWCSNKAHALAVGDFTLSARMVPDDWINTKGKRDGFAAAVANMKAYGLAFGHEMGRAHGVYAEQAARFELKAVG